MDEGVTLSRRRGRRRKGIKKRNHILRFKSEHVPGDANTLVFSTFLMAFCLTIGKDMDLQHEVGGATGAGAAAQDVAGGGGGDEGGDALLKRGGVRSR